MYNQEGHFSAQELQCSHCGKCEMDDRFLEWLAMLRLRCAFPFEILSAYRCPEHPKEKGNPTAHSKGVAVDVKASGKRAWVLVREALDMRFIGIGVGQGREHDTEYIHIDMDIDTDAPSIWCEGEGA